MAKHVDSYDKAIKKIEAREFKQAQKQRSRGKLCRLCWEPLTRLEERDNTLQRLCTECYISEVQTTQPGPWKLGRT